MRRALVIALVLSLLGGAMVGAADAKKKKKKAAPITFEASGSFHIGNPTDFQAGAGITRNEFLNTCAIPASQGVDGYVIELSEEISKVAALVTISGSDATGMHDLDGYFFSEDCSPLGEASTAAADEVGAFPPGTKYVLVSAFFGMELVFDLEAVQATL